MFHTILRPLVDAYLATAKCLNILIEKEMTESEFVKEVLNEIKTQLQHDGYCSYGMLPPFFFFFVVNRRDID